MKYKIFANHAHVCPKEVRPHGTVEKLKELMSECSIEKAVCFAPFLFHMEKAGLNTDPNDWLAKEIENEDNLYGFGTVEFDHENIEEQVKHIASLGFKGIKIHPAAQEINVLGEKACRLYEIAQEENLFLSFHTGIHWHRIADYNLLLFDEVAFNYKALRFSLEHIGGYHFFKEALSVLCNNKRPVPRVYAGWTSIDEGKDGLPSGWTISDLELRTVIYQTGEKNSIFGLDFPFKDADYTKKAIDRIDKLQISDEAKEGVLGKNLASVLNVDI